MEQKNLLSSELFSDSKEKVIHTDHLQIKGHLLRWNDVVIQISNISQISIGNYPVPRFPISALLILGVGLVSLPLNILFALVMIALGVFIIVVWYREKNSKKGHKFLHLRLNSGTVFSFEFAQESFLRRVLEIFANIFEDVERTANSNVTIDIKNCNVTGNGSIIHTLNNTD